MYFICPLYYLCIRSQHHLILTSYHCFEKLSAAIRATKSITSSNHVKSVCSSIIKSTKLTLMKSCDLEIASRNILIRREKYMLKINLFGWTKCHSRDEKNKIIEIIEQILALQLPQLFLQIYVANLDHQRLVDVAHWFITMTRIGSRRTYFDHSHNIKKKFTLRRCVVRS